MDTRILGVLIKMSDEEQDWTMREMMYMLRQFRELAELRGAAPPMDEETKTEEEIEWTAGIMNMIRISFQHWYYERCAMEKDSEKEKEGAACGKTTAGQIVGS